MVFVKITHKILWVYYGLFTGKLRKYYGVQITRWQLRVEQLFGPKKDVIFFSQYYGLKVANYGVEVPITANYG